MSGPWSGTRVLLVDAHDEPAAPHAALRRRALERLGCEVLPCDLRQKRGLLARWRGGTPADRLGRALEQHDPALVLVVDAPELTAGAIGQLRRRDDAAWAAWFLGEIRSLALMEAVGPAYDQVFVPGTDLAEELEDAGMRAHYLPGACDPSVHRPMRARDQFRANVVFVGTATPEREHLLASLVEYGLAIWGAGWRQSSLRDYCRGEALAMDDFVRAYAGASVAVNIHRTGEALSVTETGCNERVFELAAIGAPQVTDRRADLAAHFTEGEEVRTWGDAQELRAHVEALLHDPAEAERLAAAGRRRALAEHTYMHRASALLERVLGAR